MRTAQFRVDWKTKNSVADTAMKPVRRSVRLLIRSFCGPF